MKEAEKVGFVEVLKNVVDTARSDESRKHYKDMGIHLYIMGRWTLAAVIHPISTFKAVMLIGDQETINRNVEHALSLPGFPTGRKRFRL